MKAEIQDLQEAHINERQEMEQIQNELTRDLKLKYEVCISMLAWHKTDQDSVPWPSFDRGGTVKRLLAN